MTGAVILAAGAATRMGQVKQILHYQGRTLVEHTVMQAQSAGFHPVVVVLGAHAHSVAEAVGRTTSEIVINQHWQTGMGSSITAGVHRILELQPELNAIAILLADQPRVSSKHLSEMNAQLNQGNVPIVAAYHAETLGVPALFAQTVFEKLKALTPDAGARALLRGGTTTVSPYQLPEAAIDVDTPEDYEILNYSLR